MKHNSFHRFLVVRGCFTSGQMSASKTFERDGLVQTNERVYYCAAFFPNIQTWTCIRTHISTSNETFPIEKKLFEILSFDCRGWTYLTISPEKLQTCNLLLLTHISCLHAFSLSPSPPLSLSRKSKYTCFLLRRTVAGQGKASVSVHAHICQPTNTHVCVCVSACNQTT